MSEDGSPLRPQDLPHTSEGKQEPPTTPARGRTVSRYPAALSKGEPGRIPLHRRGTSRTLETMEDLLRENGYKETRIFTPEAERTEALAQERRRQSTWRIPEFLSGWLPGAAAGEPASEDVDTPIPTRSRMTTTSTHVSSVYHSTPNSPLSHKRRLHDHSASSTTLSSLGSIAAEGRTASQNPTRHHVHDRIPAVRAETSSANLRTYAQVSAARGYLRHMASTPNIPKGRIALAHDPSLNPLPASWLNTVANAVRQSGHSAHMGGPISHPASRQSDRPTRVTKSKFSFAATSASRPSGRTASGLPPGAAQYLRPQTALGAVSTAHVVCRSAPGSRSSSCVGDRWIDGGGSPRATASRKDRQDRGRRGSRSTHYDRVPSLATTRVENDPLSNIHWVDGIRVPLVRMDMDNTELDSDSDDDELDFARLLLPPKRQYSIQSLRKHLTHTQAHPQQLSPDSWEHDEGVATTEHGRQIDTGEGDGYPTFDRTGSKRRRALPGTWGNRGRP